MLNQRVSWVVTSSRAALRALVVLAFGAGMVLLTPATGFAIGAPEIQGGGLNIVNFVTLEGEVLQYGWASGFNVTADFGVDGPTLADVEVRVQGEALEFVDGFEVPFYDADTGMARVEVWGPYGEDRLTAPFLGEYSIWVRDASGAEATFVIETLSDIPNSGPQIVSGVGPGSSTPTFSWLPFQSDYNEQSVDPWAYELNLGTPEGHWIFPIDPSKTTVAFDDPGWMPDSPEALTPGFYEVALHSNHAVVTDPDGALLINFEHHVSWQIMVTGEGKVTGGGGFTSPLGAYQENPDDASRVNFGFNVKVKKGHTVPTGNLTFQLHSANLKLKAKSFEWLIVTDDYAQFAGSGTVNGAGHFGFVATVTDGSPDSMMIEIWSMDEDRLVYGSGETPTDLEQGNIVIHGR